MSKRTGYLALVILIVAALAAVLLLRPDKLPDISEEGRRLKELTIPAGSHLVEMTESRPDWHTYQAIWTFETSEPWEVYLQWLERQLGSDFRRNTSTTQPTFYRNRIGDEQLLKVEKIEEGPPIQMRVIFTSGPG